MNFYDILGVAPTATEAEIRTAYRKKASGAHPDRDGGDQSLMALLNKAKEVLTDSARRRRYDETGQSDEPTPLETLVNQEVLKVFAACIDAGVDNVLHAAIQAVAGEINRLTLQAQGCEQSARLLKRRRGKVLVKTGTNLFEELLESKIATAEQLAATIRGHLKTLDLVAKALANYETDQPSLSAPSVPSTTSSMTGTSGIFGGLFGL